MAKIVEGFFCRDKKIRIKINVNKKFRWYLPDYLEDAVEKDDVVGVSLHNTTVPILVEDILEWDGKFYRKVEKVFIKKSGYLKTIKELDSTPKKYNRLSLEDKEAIKQMKANGKKLREIAEIYQYSISSICRIINEK